MSGDGLLAIYLRDHFAASTAGRNRCRYARDRNRDGELGSLLDTLLHEIEEDRDTLRRVMARVGVEPSGVKVAASAALERLGRLKLNGQVTGYSPVSRVLDLEALSLGIEGKSLLWAALAARNDPLDQRAVDSAMETHLRLRAENSGRLPRGSSAHRSASREAQEMHASVRRLSEPPRAETPLLDRWRARSSNVIREAAAAARQEGLPGQRASQLVAEASARSPGKAGLRPCRMRTVSSRGTRRASANSPLVSILRRDPPRKAVQPGLPPIVTVEGDRALSPSAPDKSATRPDPGISPLRPPHLPCSGTSESRHGRSERRPPGRRGRSRVIGTEFASPRSTRRWRRPSGLARCPWRQYSVGPLVAQTAIG